MMTFEEWAMSKGFIPYTIEMERVWDASADRYAALVEACGDIKACSEHFRRGSDLGAPAYQHALKHMLATLAAMKETKE